MNSSATVAEVLKIADRAIDAALGKLDERVIATTEQTIINTLENCDSNYDKVFVHRLIRIVLEDLLASILQNDKKIRGALEGSEAQVSRLRNLAKEIEKVFVSDPAILAPIGTYFRKMAVTAVSQASKAKDSAVPPCPPLSEPNSSSFESKKDRSKASR